MSESTASLNELRISILELKVKKQFESAIRLIEENAFALGLASQAMLALMHEHRGMSKLDADTTIDYLHIQSLSSNNLLLELELSKAYSSGYGIGSADLLARRSLEHLIKAVDCGANGHYARQIARIYKTGNLATGIDKEKAEYWYSRAKKLGVDKEAFE